MQNLINFIKHYNSFFLFLFLELLCLSIVFSNNNFQQASYFNSARSISGKFYAQKKKLTSYISLKSINDSLLKENATLRSQLGLQISANPLKDTSYTKITVKDSVKQTIYYKHIPAKILNNSIDQKRNYMTLNVGVRDGIKKNMAVISDKGIIGRITHVNEHFSVAQSLLSEKFTVSVTVPDGTTGLISWDGKDPALATLTGIPQSVKIKPWDTIRTSGFSYFPENIMVGRVVQAINGNSFKVWLTQNFRNLHYVYVIEDNTLIERTIFEDSLKAIE
ncbi:MAG: rod shape-determining protein MreC [Chitinophagaceae bacterium]|nr:rod shape-determining protein MreC [Chitinophagaceae bacterium]